MIKPLNDIKISAAMIDTGGSFVQTLGKLFRLGDGENKRRLKEAFPEYWGKYADIAAGMQCPECGSIDRIRRHHPGSAAVPECSFWECEDCGHQEGHE